MKISVRNKAEAVIVSNMVRLMIHYVENDIDLHEIEQTAITDTLCTMCDNIVVEQNVKK